MGSKSSGVHPCPHAVCKGEGHGLEIKQVVTTHLSLVSNIFVINPSSTSSSPVEGSWSLGGKNNAW